MATVYLTFDATVAGETLTFAVYRQGVQLGSAVASQAALGSGLYSASATIDMSSFGAGFVNLILVDSFGAPVNSERGYVGASGTYTPEAASASVTVSAPVGTAGSITRIYKGVSYSADNGTAFEWTFANPGTIATPGDNTCTFQGKNRADATQTWSVNGTLSDAGGGNLTATFEFTTSTVASLSLGDYEWKVTCVDDNADVILIASTDRQRLTRLIDM